MVFAAIPAPAAAADLQPRTAAGFDQYVRAIEAQMPRRPTFLWIDRLGHGASLNARDMLRHGGLLIEPIDRDDTGVGRDIPGGLIHHWIGTVFVPGAVDSTLALLQDYDRHASIYAPAVSGSKLLWTDGRLFRMHLRFTMTRVLTVVVNTDNEAVFSRDAPDRASSRIHSTRVAEVENAGTPGERELPVGHDGGYLWRLNTYWRLLQADDGVYIECESISLTRDIPFGLGWVVKPFVTSLPKDSLAFTLEATRTALTEPGLLPPSRVALRRTRRAARPTDR
jgi:hypothetical protein